MNRKALEIRDRVVAEMEAGKAFEFDQDVTIAEMIGTGDVPDEFLETVTYKLEEGREQVPLLYKPIYTTTSDRSLPKTLTRKTQGGSRVVFLEKFEGGEVSFGDIEAGPEVTVSLRTWAAGLQFSEDYVEYNQLYEVGRDSIEFGRVYNQLLNHLHLGPFTEGNFVTTGGGVEAQRLAQVAGTAQLVAWDTDLLTTLRNAVKILPKGSIILYNPADVDILNDAIASDLLTDNSPGVVKRTLNMANAIAYEGASITVGKKTYDYPGVDVGEIYIIVPKVNFEEFIKHDLITDAGDGDLSRLVLSQMVGRARRGALAVIGGAEGAIKVTITG